jgi:transcriptional regulator with XRE-family HTH domain
MSYKPRVTDFDVKVGARVRAARQLRGLSSAEIAAAVGVSTTQWWKYEQGTNRLAGERLLAVCRLTGTSADALLGRAEAPSSEARMGRDPRLELMRLMGELDEPSQRAVLALARSLARQAAPVREVA